MKTALISFAMLDKIYKETLSEMPKEFTSKKFSKALCPKLRAAVGELTEDGKKELEAFIFNQRNFAIRAFLLRNAEFKGGFTYERTRGASITNGNGHAAQENKTAAQELTPEICINFLKNIGGYEIRKVTTVVL